MGHRTLVAVARADGLFDCRLAHWGVDADPIAQSRLLGTGWDRSRVRAELDATVETLVVLDDEVSTYCVCWLDPTLTDLNDIALARSDDSDGLREWWTEAKSRACDLVAEGTDPTDARADLLSVLRSRADTVHVDDASFLGDDR